MSELSDNEAREAIANTRVLAARPTRIQRKRSKGWRMPEGVVYVGRPSKWGNPFAVGDDLAFPYNEFGGPIVRDRDHAVELFAVYAQSRVGYGMLAREALYGRDLACWCPLDRLCHADVLLVLANGVDVSTLDPFRHVQDRTNAGTAERETGC